MPYDLSNLQWDCNCADQPARMAGIMQTVQGYLDYLETFNRPFAIYFKETEPNNGEWATVWNQQYGTLDIPLWSNLLWVTQSGFGGYYINTPNGVALIDSPYAPGRVELKRLPQKDDGFFVGGVGYVIQRRFNAPVAFNLARPAVIRMNLHLSSRVIGGLPLNQRVDVRARLIDATATVYDFIAPGVDTVHVMAAVSPDETRPHSVHMMTQWAVPAGAWTFEVYIMNNNDSIRWGSYHIEAFPYPFRANSTLEIVYV